MNFAGWTWSRLHPVHVELTSLRLASQTRGRELAIAALRSNVAAECMAAELEVLALDLV